MTAPLLQAHEVVKSFAQSGGLAPRVALAGVSLEVHPGEFVSIVGPSGSGKSTLLYCLGGLEPPTSGRIEIAGIDITRLTRKRLAAVRRDRIGFIFQSYNLIPSLTARENVALPARLARRRASPDQVDQALASVGLAELRDAYPGTLSGGQQQRVAIARVLMSSPDIVFADEPTGALDSAAGAAVLDLLRTAAEGDRAVVMVTHDLAAAARADRVIVIRDGHINRELVAPTARDIFEAIDHQSGAR